MEKWIVSLLPTTRESLMKKRSKTSTEMKKYRGNHDNERPCFIYNLSLIYMKFYQKTEKIIRSSGIVTHHETKCLRALSSWHLWRTWRTFQPIVRTTNLINRSRFRVSYDESCDDYLPKTGAHANFCFYLIFLGFVLVCTTLSSKCYVSKWVYLNILMF